MTTWTSERVAGILGSGSVTHRVFSGISTDTRQLGAGALFVALVGERFDGHDFLEAAREAGAAGAVVRGDTPRVDGLEWFPVDDTLEALGRLAAARRATVSGPVVGVTGSNGKTTTKEMVAALLGRRWRVGVTEANLNNLVGVPLTILDAADDVEALVVEAGASERGEMGRLHDIIQPTIGIITNVSAAHLEGFGSLEAVLTEKVSLVRDVPLAVVGITPPELARAAGELAERVIVAGVGASAQVRPDAWRIGAEGRATLTFHGREIHLPVVGPHQVENAVLALAVAEHLGIAGDAATAALEGVRPLGGRCEVLARGSLVILNDSYNANPASVRASLETALAMRGTRRFVVAVGSMLELGRDSHRLHVEAAQAVLDAGPEVVAATGAFVPAFGELGLEANGDFVAADDPEALGQALRQRIRGDEIILVKASRGIRMERLIPILAGESGD